MLDLKDPQPPDAGHAEPPMDAQHEIPRSTTKVALAKGAVTPGTRYRRDDGCMPSSIAAHPVPMVYAMSRPSEEVLDQFGAGEKAPSHQLTAPSASSGLGQ